MARRRTKEDKPGEANVLPVMNVMFLLIPSLLLAMEVASMAAVVVSPPKSTVDNTTTPGDPPKDDWRVHVQVASDGIYIREGGEVMGEGGPSIPTVDGEQDFERLEAVASELKVAHPEVSNFEITAEGDVPLVDLIDAMDAMRGDECSLAGVASGEGPSKRCLFWAPTVSSR